MYCKKCGKQVEDGSSFCPYCGADLREQEVEVVEAESEKNEVSRGPWKAFAIVGYFLGIVGFVTSFLIFGMEFSVFGIVFSALGLKTTDEEAKAKAKKGLKLSIAATIISVVLLFALMIVLVALIASGAVDVEEIVSYIEQYVEMFN